VPTRKIDLNPQGPLEVRAGEDLLVMIDFDLHNSIKINETGNGQVRFRPLVKIAAGVSGLVRLYGTYTVDSDSGDTSICNIERAYDADGIDPLDLCVALDETATHYFGADGTSLFPGEPDNPGDLTDADLISVYGTYRENAEEPVLEAEIIARAHSKPFDLLYGLVTSAFDAATEQFEMARRQATEGAPAELVPVVLSDGAKVFNIDGDLLDPSAIEVAKLAEAQGVMTTGAVGEPDFLQAFFAFVSEATGNDSVSGVIQTPDGIESLISIDTSDVEDVCVSVTPTTEYYQLAIVDDGSGQDVIDLQKIVFADLIPGDMIDVSGDQEGDCIQAITVIREM
jgi:hypothetical protein